MGTRTSESDRTEGKHTGESWCDCPAGTVARGGHEGRVRSRAERILDLLRGSAGGLPVADVRAEIGASGCGEALSALLSRGLIEHIGERGTASAGYRAVI